MSNLLVTNSEVFLSGEVVEPGVYEDLDTGALLEIHEPDELPDGTRVVRYRRRFRRVSGPPQPASSTDRPSSQPR